jgi:hypothetical protein
MAVLTGPRARAIALLLSLPRGESVRSVDSAYLCPAGQVRAGYPVAPMAYGPLDGLQLAADACGGDCRAESRGEV